MSQTTVSAGGQAIGVAGQIMDSMEGRDVVSGFNKESSAQIPFGYGVRVQLGSNGDAYLLPTGFSTVGGDVAGVNVFSFNHMKLSGPDPAGLYSGDLGGTGLVPNASMQVARRARVLVPVQAAVRAGDRGYCVGVATGNVPQGLWAGSGYGASYHIDCTRQTVFRSPSYTAADGTTLVAVLEVDFTNKP